MGVDNFQFREYAETRVNVVDNDELEVEEPTVTGGLK